MPADLTDDSAASTSRSRTIGRWKTLPALARTHFPLCGSTASPSNSTASAPIASAVRISVPALPGSRGSTATASRRGPDDSTSARDASSSSARAKIPGGVVASESFSAARSDNPTTSTPAPDASPRTSACRSASLSRTRTCSARPLSSAAATALAPSTRNLPSDRRTDARWSFAYDTTREDRSDKISIR
ncbi:Uncharacterised protein [Mycobacteroides abscessus subsp. abscessus]|nr:Uncharacterised protein [Mycobacteroides abscessus subsp. abscessus]